ncbi:predicted protein [Sclerotinia sclerotiorum 1980 UF-70]|uniref:Uncharacterized protein n=2 Tax=Sclerotinia sclerotiorum (strain ATCC 18683 / 1980 / Ss-1) TaxID=665079 RepID=A7F8W7_SCLS1|nr:predicted protein [Sclerotinia sclerotiorum 1980 UF-70]APA13148.1 hypothetical protein sscle_10g079180 [Sclerotinia sclerotiorum 1980 UF-70]EDN99188.1 predicted protein [Sclerotinia sclerotiorum 1980 UF-70]
MHQRPDKLEGLELQRYEKVRKLATLVGDWKAFTARGRSLKNVWTTTSKMGLFIYGITDHYPHLVKPWDQTSKSSAYGPLENVPACKHIIPDVFNVQCTPLEILHWKKSTTSLLPE